MISSLIKSISLENYKGCNEQFIYGVDGIIRLTIGREIIYRMSQASISDYFIDAPHIGKVECIFAVTNRRIILIPKDEKCSSISFNYGEISVVYHNQVFDKIFLLYIKDRELLNFPEKKLVFSVYPKQNVELNKINCILMEYSCE